MIKINYSVTKPVILDIPPPPTPFTSDFSLLHDGVNEYSNIGSSPVYEFGVNLPFSVSLWFNREGGTKYLISRRLNNGTTFRGWSLLILNNIFEFALVDDDAAGKRKVRKHNVTVPTFAWIHLVVTYDGSGTIGGMRIYFDGVESGNYVTVADGTLDTISVTTPLHIGALEGAVTFNGNIDDVDIWNRALIQAEITSLNNLGAPLDTTSHAASANLIGSWGMGDLSTFSGGNWTITDRSPSGLDAVTVNMEEADRVTDVPS